MYSGYKPSQIKLGLATLRRSVSGDKQNSSGNLKILVIITSTVQIKTFNYSDFSIISYQSPKSPFCQLVFIRFFIPLKSSPAPTDINSPSHKLA